MVAGIERGWGYGLRKPVASFAGKRTLTSARYSIVLGLLLNVSAAVAMDLGSGFATEVAGTEPGSSPTVEGTRPATPDVLIARLPGPSPAGDTALPSSSPRSPLTASPPAIVEWLNQNVRLPDTTQAFDKPSSDGEPSACIRARAEIKAIGRVADKHWVQIELLVHSRAYVPRATIEFENGLVASSAPAARQGASASVEAAAPGVIHGSVTRVPNATTLVVGDQRLRLSGIDPGPQEALPPFENWARGQGALTSEPDAQTGRYHCFTGGGVDGAEAAILNGAGPVGDGATPAYRERETRARTAKCGFWTEP
jgi:endonuclease YncB( thermonuclease family)